jgi:hypothetical protein
MTATTATIAKNKPKPEQEPISWHDAQKALGDWLGWER